MNTQVLEPVSLIGDNISQLSESTWSLSFIRAILEIFEKHVGIYFAQSS